MERDQMTLLPDTALLSKEEDQSCLRKQEMSSFYFPSCSPGAISRIFPVIIFKDKFPGLEKGVSDYWLRMKKVFPVVQMHILHSYVGVCA